MNGDPNAIRKEIDEAERRRDGLVRKKQDFRLKNAGNLTVDMKLAMDGFDRDIADTENTVVKLRRAKRDAEVIQSDDALDYQPRIRNGPSLTAGQAAPKAEVTVNINGAPPGTRVEQPATTNTKLTVNQNTGRRAMASPTS